MMYKNIREEELKNKVGADWFKAFDTTEIVGNIDFTVFPKQDSIFGRTPLLWAEAKTGDFDLTTMFVQLVLTIGKARTFDKTLPPAFLGAFDFKKIAFVPYISVQDIFYLNDFNWNVTPSNHETKEFKLIKDRIEATLKSNSYVYDYQKDEKDLKTFVANNIAKATETIKIKIDKNNFTPIYLRWLEIIKPNIDVNWDELKKANILDSDFYLADLFVDDKDTNQIYIRSTTAISPQNTFRQSELLPNIVEYNDIRLKSIEPDYKAFIDLKSIRRMSRIIKMGVTAGLACLQDAQITSPDAIITGTAYGCLEDTGVFLSKLVEFKEQMLTPTAFIQSTHNTVGSQIALMLQCHNYNNTFVHRGFSFESALLDATTLIEANEANSILIGSIDEITNYSHAILTRMGLYKRNTVSNLKLYDSHSKGTINGEGAAFFVLSNQPSTNDYAILDGFATFYKPTNSTEIEVKINAFLSEQQVAIADIDLIITGKNGDVVGDGIYTELEQSIFKNKTTINYKHLCGEYPTATSFALWLAANIIKSGQIPASFEQSGNKVKKILIYNHSQQAHHSLFLLSR
jgi:3-oxoacyl-[acyl-carrier-protein] synthase II